MKKTLFISLIIFLLYILIQAIRMNYYVRIGNRLAEQGEEIRFERIVPNAEMRILNIGDSSVVGVGAEDSNKTVAGRIGKTFPEAEIINLGVSGEKVAELVPRLRNLQEEKYDLVVMQIGGNDIVRLTPVKEAKADLETSVELAKNLSDKVILLHGGDVGTARLLPLGTRWIFTKRTQEFREAWMGVAEQDGVFYVDLFPLREADPFVQNPKKYYAPDMFHPSDEGYGIWFDEIEKHL